MKLEVTYSPLARDALAKMKAARPDSAQSVAYRGLSEVIRCIVSDSDIAFLPQFRLKRDLVGILRVKKGRLRLFYIASSQKGRAIVLMIGYRKAGDKNDAYEELSYLLKRGAFKPQFDELGLPMPGS